MEGDVTQWQERLLIVMNEHGPRPFTAAAVWVKRLDEWECVEAAPILKWMVGSDPKVLASYFRRKGWSYTWIKLR